MAISKTTLTIAGVAAALLLGGGIYLMIHMNALTKNYVERVASETLGVKVSIGSLSIDLKQRMAKASGLTIGNPEGFKESYAVKVETISIALGDVTRQLVSFKDIDVSDAQVNLEVKENITNLAAIKNNISIPSGQKADAVKLIIDKLALSQAQIHPGKLLFTNDDLAPVLVPDIILTGVGEKEGGVLAHEAIAQIWAHIAHKLNV